MSANKLVDSNYPLEPVATVAKRITGKRPSPATIYRWCRKGLAGGRIRLKWVFHSGAMHTTEAAFREFIAAQTEHHAADAPHCSDDNLRTSGLL